jgi:hypothetical protein
MQQGLRRRTTGIGRRQAGPLEKGYEPGSRIHACLGGVRHRRLRGRRYGRWRIFRRRIRRGCVSAGIQL